VLLAATARVCQPGHAPSTGLYNIDMGTTRSPWRAWVLGSAALLAGGGALVARAGLTLDIGVGRRMRPLGPIRIRIAAPPEVVFDVIAAPYLGRTPRAMRSRLEVLERGSDLVLAAHFTPLARGLTVTTVETVRFERPHRISFRLVKGPVPHVMERYELQPHDGGTTFEYTGELGTDLWGLGAWWGDRVAPSWERTVAASVEGIRTEAERRAGT
jgi:polyketide cyclase/dehydrase/lipid transport protein